MNLNELLINKGRGRGRRKLINNPNAVSGVKKVRKSSTSLTNKKSASTPASELNWGRSHISILNTTSSARKSAGSSKISSEEAESKIIVALTEGRGEARCEVGIAAISVSRPLLILCQISDTPSYINTLTKINIFNPHEILFPSTFVDNFSGNRLIDILKKQFPKIKYTATRRNTFNKANGLEILSNLCIPSCNGIILVLQHRYYALAAVSALITHIQDVLFIYYASESIKLDYQESEGYALIDISTTDRLELVCSAKPSQSNRFSSLFGVLNHCQTKIGARNLRSSILRPPFHVKYIEERLDCVTELVKHPESLLAIQALLQNISNVDQLLGIGTIIPVNPHRCCNRQLNYVLLLNSLIDLLPPLKDAIANFKQPFFVDATETLSHEGFGEIRKMIRKLVPENAHPVKGQSAAMQRCFAIKPGINGLLDVVRKTYSERINDMREYVKTLSEKYSLPLTLSNNQTKGYHIVLNMAGKQKHMKKSDFPEEFVQVQRLAGSFTLKTAELVNLSIRLDDIMVDILKISDVMVHNLVVEVKRYTHLFYTLCEQIAHLDLLQSLAETSLLYGYVRPSFGEFTEMTFSRHPLLDFLLPKKPISNPISCSDDFNVHIITGPNGSGKSIFIRQVLLLQVMAQLGCYVPVQSAVVRPADFMFARIYLEDDMEYGASSFVLEMKEIKYVLQAMTKNSVVIMDELCRSTSVEEGTALAMAIVEKMARSSAYIYITTHYNMLTKLYDMYPNVKVWQMETVPSGDDPRTFKLDFRFNLLPGVNSVKHYSVYLVRNIWPESIVGHVYEMLDEMSKNKSSDVQFAAMDEKVRLKYSIEAEFKKLKSQKKLTIAKFNKLINQYQCDLQKLGYSINVTSHAGNEEFHQDARTSCFSLMVENLPDIRHSILEEDMLSDQVPGSSLREELLPSTLSEQSEDTKRVQERMMEMFTPEPTQQPFRQQEDFRHPNIINSNFERATLSQFGMGDVENMEQNDYKLGDANSVSSYSYQGQHQLPDGVVLNFTRHSNTSLADEQNARTMSDVYQQDRSDVQYANISKFLAENSENVNKLVPEVCILEDTRRDINFHNFSLPLVYGSFQTSTPLPQLSLPTRPNFYCPNIQTYGCHKADADTSIVCSGAIDECEIESLRQELEECSRILEEDDDDLEEAESSKQPKEYDFYPRNTYKGYLSPKVEIEIGPDDKTISFGEEDEDRRYLRKEPQTKMMIEDVEIEKEATVTNREKISVVDKNVEKRARTEAKVNIITNIAITPGGNIKCIQAKNKSTQRVNEDSMASTECLRNEPENELALQNTVAEPQTQEPPGETDLYNLSEASTEQLLESFLDSIEADTVDKISHAEDLEGNESGLRRSANEDNTGKEHVNSGRKERMDKISQVTIDNKTGFMPSDVGFGIIDLENYRYSEADMGAKTTDVEVVVIGNNEPTFQSPDRNVEGMDVGNDASNFKSLDQKDDVLDAEYSETRFKLLDNNVRDVNKLNNDSSYKLPDDNVRYAEIGDNESRYELPDDNLQDANIEYNDSRLSENKGSENNGPGFKLPADDMEIDPGKNGMESSNGHNGLLDNPQNRIEAEETVAGVNRRPEEDTTTTADPSISKRTPASTSSSSNYKIETLARTEFGADTTGSNSPAKPKRIGVSRPKKRSFVTSTSQASRLRNLDPTSSDSSHQEKSSSTNMATTSSISDASKKRNLDQVSSSTTKGSDPSSSSKKSTSKTGTNANKPTDSSGNGEETLSRISKLSNRKPRMKKFMPPRKLSKREIREDFELQDRLLLESSYGDPNMSKYLGQLLNRPSVQQIQNTTHLALIRKTKEGVEVIPADPRCKRRKQTYLKKYYSKEQIDMDMFSDKNAEHFQEYLNSNEKNFKNFNMNFNKKTEETTTNFKLQPVQPYTEGSIVTSFTRKFTDENIDRNFQFPSQRSSYSYVKSQSSMKHQQEPPMNISLTPDGYYKRNKSDIMDLVNKYLNTSSQKYTQEQNRAGSSTNVNIFENNYPSPDDLAL